MIADRGAHAISSYARGQAIWALEAAASSGLTLHEVIDSGSMPARLARKACDAVMRTGCASAVKLEAAAMLRDGWSPGRSMTFSPARSIDQVGGSGKACAVCARDVSGRPVKIESLGRGGADVVVCSGEGCDRSPREGRHSFGRGDRMI